MALIARYLDVKLYGLYAYITSIIAVVIPFTYFGMQRILIREIARDRAGVGRYLGTAIIGRTIFSAFLLAGVFAFTVYAGFDRMSMQATLVFTVSEIILSYVSLFISVYTAVEKMDADTILTAFSRVFNLALLLAVIFFDLGFVSLFTTMALSSALTLVVAALMTSRGIGRPDYAYDAALLKYFFRESYPLVIVGFLTAALFRVDVFVLKYFRGVEEISLFFAPHSIITRLQVVPLALTTAIFPALARLADTSREEFAALYGKTAKFLFAVSLPLTILAHIYAREFVVLFFGPRFAEAGPAFQIMIWSVNIMFLECLL
jgi:O-antigen/teichoic acid export membrane protein